MTSGLPGFGCYRREVVNEVLSYLDWSGLNLRMCIANASQSSTRIEYRQADCTRGPSSYLRWLFLLANYLSASSQYQGGVATVMPRQIESLRMFGFRPRLRSRLIQGSKGKIANHPFRRFGLSGVSSPVTMAVTFLRCASP